VSASKLGWHFQMIPGWASGLVNSTWVKIIDPPSNNIFPRQKAIGRVYIPDNEANAMIMRGSIGAEEWFARCQPAYERAPWIWCWEGPNEPPVAAPEQRAALVAFTRRWVQLMHAGSRKTVTLCLGVGWPDIGRAEDLAGALETTDYWALHEYAASAMQDQASWLCLRYRRTVDELAQVRARIPPLLITECGIDGGVIGVRGAGWKTFTDRPGYLNQLMWYDGELRQDDYVEVATIFTSGPNWDWTDFDADEPLSRMLAGYIGGRHD
jgi:hypothetical protein